MQDDLIDMPEVPDVPDDEDDEESGEGGEGGSGAEGGRLGALIARLVGRVAPLLAPLQPVLERVPSPILAGVASGVVVVLFAVILSALTGHSSATPPAEAGEDAAQLALVDDSPTATPRPPTPTRGPTATPTPVLWEEQPGGVLVGHGFNGPSRLEMMRPEKMHLVDDTRDPYTIVTRFQVLTASGPAAPQWGVLLSYFDERNHVVLQGSTDQDRVPIFNLIWAKDGNGGTIGETVHVPEMPYWGRDVHELRVSGNKERIRAWVDNLLIGSWTNKDHQLPGGQKGLFVWFAANMRFESYVVE